MTLAAPLPPDPAYPAELVSIGNHIRKRRLDLRLLQREVAAEIGVSTQTLQYWEVGRHEPEVRHLPAIIRFLGYDPSPKATTLGQAVRWTRRVLGLSQKELARDLGIAPSTVREIEAEHVPSLRIRMLIDAFLDAHR